MSDDSTRTLISASEPGQRRSSAWFKAAVILVLLGVFYLYVLLRIRPHLLYHQQYPIFLTTLAFLKNCLVRPGGLLTYVSVFLVQFNMIPWLGALVLTLTALLICLATKGFLTVLAGRRPPLPVVLMPAVGLLILLGRYQYDPSTGTALLAALALAYLYVRTAPRRTLPAFLFFLVSSLVIYAIAGSAYALYAILCAVFELISRRRLVLGLLALLCLAVPYGFSMYSYELSASAAYTPLLPFREGAPLSFWGMETLPRILHIVLVCFFPVAAVAVGILGRRSSGTSVVEETSPARIPTLLARWAFPLLVLFTLAAAAAILWSFDGDARTRLEISYYSQCGKWNTVLERARRLPTARWTHYDMHDVTRALYHSGRLLDEMFSYPQTRDVDSLLLERAHGGRPETARAHLKRAVVYFELGHINRAMSNAHIIVEDVGEHPEALRLMAKVYIVKGHANMARSCLGALRKNLLYRNEADDWLAKLEADPEMTSNEEIRRVRSFIPRTDSFSGTLDVTEHGGALQLLLRANPHNRMAFEYAMAYYLLTRQFDNVIGLVVRLGDFGYNDIPRHGQEAVVLYQRANRNQNVNLYGKRISDETRNMGKAFLNACAPYVTNRRLDRDRAGEALAPQFGKTYFFYRTFHFSGFGPKPPQPDAVTGATK